MLGKHKPKNPEAEAPGFCIVYSCCLVNGDHTEELHSFRGVLYRIGYIGGGTQGGVGAIGIGGGFHAIAGGSIHISPSELYAASHAGDGDDRGVQCAAGFFKISQEAR